MIPIGVFGINIELSWSNYINKNLFKFFLCKTQQRLVLIYSQVYLELEMKLKR